MNEWMYVDYKDVCHHCVWSAVGRSVGWLAGRLKKAVRNEATNNVKDDP